jgi:hypothetical protein
MGASNTLPSNDQEALADLAAAALERDPADWDQDLVAVHLRSLHPQIAAGNWPDDNPYAAHQADHRDWNYDHEHPTRDQAKHLLVRDRSAASLSPNRVAPVGASAGSPDEWFAELNPDFGVLPDERDPRQHRFAADREQALALGTRTIEALGIHNHEDPDQRARALTGAYVEVELDVASPVAHRPIPERARGGPER